MKWTGLKMSRKVRLQLQKPLTFSKFKSALMRNAEQGNIKTIRTNGLPSIDLMIIDLQEVSIKGY